MECLPRRVPVGATNFGDSEFKKLRQLPHLNRIVLSDTRMGNSWSNIASGFPPLTYVVLWSNGTSKSWDMKR
jgi:hypothetical protein